MYFDISQINPNLKNKSIILGSKSPRRAELLKGLQIRFKTIVHSTEEIVDSNLSFEDIATSIALQKAEAFSEQEKTNAIIITADTIVCLQDKVLGKPTSVAHAKMMLEQLSNQTHLVVTGVCLTSENKQVLFSETTEVTFKKLSPIEIDFYVDNFNPMDKAGAYGIQEWIGYVGVKNCKGSYNNVIGLPVERLYQELKKW